MASKYLKNEKGIVRAITTDNLQLEKPLLNENYDIEVHNRNMEKIDEAIQEVKGKVDGLELTAQRVSIADSTNKFEATNVEDALLENKTSILKNTSLANQALTKANEAFQRGDNVKTQLVDKLISEGLEVSTNNTFEELIGSIALGKKWAKGISEKASVSSVYPNINSIVINLNNLNFMPSSIIAFSSWNNKYSNPFIFYTKELENDIDNQSIFSEVRVDSTASTAIEKKHILVSGNYIYLPSLRADVVYNWIAFE